MNELESQTAGDAERWARLTDKQRACLDLLIERKTSKQIARELDIAKVTVDQRIKSARDILGASNRDEAAIIYSRLKPIYDRMIYDPVGLARASLALPIDGQNGDEPVVTATSDRMTKVGKLPRQHSPFRDLWRRDHSPSNVVYITAIIAVSLAVFVLTGLGIAQALTQLISG